MTDWRAGDHALGLELQLEELVEQRERARVQGRTDDLPPIDGEIRRLQDELAATAEAAVTVSDVGSEAGPVIEAKRAGS